MLLRTAKPCGPGCRCYGQAERRCIEPTGFRCIVNSRGDGDKNEFVTEESAHKPSATAQGRPGCFRLHLYAAVLCVCNVLAQWTAGASRRLVFPAPFLLERVTR